jgi:uncharacterized protein YuzE
MKVMYDPTADIVSMILSSASVAESDEVRPGVILDFDQEGRVVAIEILDASRRMDAPDAMEFEISAEAAP